MKINVNIREYSSNDKHQLLKIFDLNAPTYFSPEEKAGFQYYLENELELYYVIEFENAVVGCGGINFNEFKTIGIISWDMLHPDFQGKSFESYLLKHRLDKLKSIKSIEKITVRTSQLTYRFYEKHGFTIIEIVKDYWAEGFDLYNMEYKISTDKNSPKCNPINSF